MEIHKKGKKSNRVWYRTIVFKLMCMFFATLLPTIFLYVNLYRNFQRDTITNLSETTYKRDIEIFEGFYAKIEQIEYYVWDLYANSNLTYLSDMWDYYDQLEKAEKIADIQQQLQWYHFMEDFISDLRVYLPQRNVCIHNTYWRYMDETDLAVVEQYFSNPEALLIDRGNVHIYLGNLSQGSSIDQIRSVCRLTISEYKFRELMEDLTEDGIAEAAILIDGEVLRHTFNDQTVLEAVLIQNSSADPGENTYEFDVFVEKERYFCALAGDYNSRIQIITCRSYDAVFSKSRDNFRLVYLLILTNILVFAIFLLYVKRNIKKPVNILSDAFLKIQDGNERVILEESSHDEFDDLYMGFNEMSTRLSEYVKNNYLMKIDLQREQLKQLQSQINPHFLFNTLLLTKIRIGNGKLEGATKMIELLSDYFRTMNRNKRDVIYLNEELDSIHTYMNIQTERFSDRLSFIVEPIPPCMDKVLIPRLLLQPLVENAVKYGMEQVEKNCVIRVYFTIQSEKLKIIIAESGIQITQQQIAQMNYNIMNPDKNAEITSTINIDKRIKLFYGEQYGLHYEREEDDTLKAIVFIDGGKKDELEGSSG